MSQDCSKCDTAVYYLLRHAMTPVGSGVGLNPARFKKLYHEAHTAAEKAGLPIEVVHLGVVQRMTKARLKADGYLPIPLWKQTANALVEMERASAGKGEA